MEESLGEGDILRFHTTSSRAAQSMHSCHIQSSSRASTKHPLHQSDAREYLFEVVDILDVPFQFVREAAVFDDLIQILPPG